MLFLAKLKRSKIFSRFILSLQQRRIYGYFSCIGRKLVFSHTSFVKCNPRPTRYNEITRTPIFQTPEKAQLVSFPSEQPRLNCSATFTLLRRSKIFGSVVSSFTTKLPQWQPLSLVFPSNRKNLVDWLQQPTARS